VTSTWCCS